MKNKKTFKAVLSALAAITVMIFTQTALFAAETLPMLPDAGGRGTVLIYVVGGLLVFGSVVGLLWVIWLSKNDKDK